MTATSKKNSLCTSLLALCFSALCFQTVAQNFDPSKIEIVRDTFGVPHIFAKTDAEVAYGLAWATLEDDTANAQFLLLAAKGVLARHLGVEGAKIDYAAQLMGVIDFVEEHYEKDVPEDYKRVLEGYCAGANAYAKAHPKELFVKEKFFNVRPQEALAGYMLGLSLMAGVDGTINDILNGGVLQKLPEGADEGIGSNAIAFNSKMTSDGNTYLDINSHQPLEGLLSWYEAHLCSEEGWNITGSLFHGGLSIFHGTNPNLGWAHTTGHVDGIDVFQLTMHPRKRNFYKFDGKWLKLETKCAKLRVKIGKKEKKGFILAIGKKYWKSVYGPTLKTKHGTFAMRLPALLTLKAGEQWYRMNKAQNYTEFLNALKIQGISHQNVTYADKNDTICLIANGLFPVRDLSYDWNKVVPGDTSATLWNSYYPVESYATFLNPECGFVFNVNNSAFDGSAEDCNLDGECYAPTMGYKEEVNNRSLRFYELMEQYGSVNYDDFKRIKFDHTYPKKIKFLRDFPLDEFMTLNEEKYPDIADAIKKIKAFDLTADSLDPNFATVLLSMLRLYENSGGKEDSLRKNKDYRIELAVKSIREGKEHLIKHFGSIDVLLGKVQVLERGGKALPINGCPDCIRAAYSQPMTDGRMRIWVGDSFVQLVKFTKAGPEIESIHSYGASSRPYSKHYNDQMELFVAHKLKKRSLNKEEVYKSAERIYHPQ